MINIPEVMMIEKTNNLVMVMAMTLLMALTLCSPCSWGATLFAGQAWHTARCPDL